MLSLFFIYVNICFVTIILVHYRKSGIKTGLKSSYAVTLVFTILAPLFVFLGINWYAILISIFMFNSTYFVTTEFAKLKSYYDGFYKDELKAIQETFHSLKLEDDKISIANKRLDKRIFEIANLYEITKEMSTTLQCLDIFEILAKFLIKNFSFRSCKLILVSQKEPESIDKIYSIHGAATKTRRDHVAKPKAHSIEPNEIDLSLLKEMLDKKHIIQVSSFSKILDSQKQYLPKNIEGFLATPISVDNNLIGILSIEDLSVDEFENFLILNRQFELEMRKVRLYETVQELAITDGLTGAYVRRHFLERVDEELKRSRRHKFKLSFLMLDIDHFKECNDTYGHLVGDAVLRQIVGILKTNIRQIDLVARYGGEEFSILLPETNKEGAVMVANRICQAVAQDKFQVYDEFTNISVSIGVATFPDDAQKRNELIDKADKALYQAKNEGRNRVCAFE